MITQALDRRASARGLAPGCKIGLAAFDARSPPDPLAPRHLPSQIAMDVYSASCLVLR